MTDADRDLARAEIVVTDLSARAGMARIILGARNSQGPELVVAEDDWRRLRQLMHEHLDRALDVMEASDI